MRHQRLTILNIGLDRALLLREVRTESQIRQIFYVRNLPAHQVCLVKAPFDMPPERIELDEDLSIVPCPVRHWASFVPAAIRAGTTLMKRTSFDLIQVQEPFLSGVVGACLSQRFHVPLVVSLFGDEIDNPVWLAERPLNLLANFVGKLVLRRASAVRCDSLTVRHRLMHYGFRHLTYIPFLITHADRLLAPDPRAQTRRQHLLGAFSGPLLLAVCRLEQEKNVVLLLQAVEKAVLHHPGLVLAVAGDGTLADALKQDAMRRVPGRVRWLGWVDNTELPAYYQAADLLLLSSNRESAARVLYESLLAGTPVLTTDTAGAREVVEDDTTGRIVPVGDVHAFSNALIELCYDVERLREMGAIGRERLSARVTGEAVVRQLRLLYEKALGHV